MKFGDPIKLARWQEQFLATAGDQEDPLFQERVDMLRDEWEFDAIIQSAGPTDVGVEIYIHEHDHANKRINSNNIQGYRGVLKPVKRVRIFRVVGEDWPGYKPSFKPSMLLKLRCRF